MWFPQFFQWFGAFLSLCSVFRSKSFDYFIWITIHFELLIQDLDCGFQSFVFDDEVSCLDTFAQGELLWGSAYACTGCQVCLFRVGCLDGHVFSDTFQLSQLSFCHRHTRARIRSPRSSLLGARRHFLGLFWRQRIARSKSGLLTYLQINQLLLRSLIRSTTKIVFLRWLWPLLSWVCIQIRTLPIHFCFPFASLSFRIPLWFHWF